MYEEALNQYIQSLNQEYNINLTLKTNKFELTILPHEEVIIPSGTSSSATYYIINNKETILIGNDYDYTLDDLKTEILKKIEQGIVK